MAGKPVRLLCLHGYKQNGDVFRKKTGAFRKLLKKTAEYHFITAPHLIPQTEGGEENLTGWWFSAEGRSYVAQDVTDFSAGLDESLDLVARNLKDHGPFDGILAFSQGASLLSIICSLREKGDERFQALCCAIFVAGYRSRQTAHQELYADLVTIPTLHVIGDTDQVIPRAMSDDMLRNFQDPVVLRHDGGHFVPSKSAQKSAYVDFLKNACAWNACAVSREESFFRVDLRKIAFSTFFRVSAKRPLRSLLFTS